ncbi:MULTISPECIES: PIN domain-containing protein [Pseudomonas]|uniref:PIN domain-containing protein n=1 Tax=Pseudomonas TaxID=286 RepID=UPI0002D5A5E6|nr:MULTISPECIES: PIN domain-containing protein [Pseudomonas]KMU97664.1 hypothetical protein AC138_00330 [Pseudomonas putida]KMY34024.1 hypothetical protein AA993_15680 [Pseudomonas putida]MDD2080885.1 PIN domain-containing protein [Pseudomonas putida]PXZ53370.1 hypothetical protein DM483_04870 [Pseudomonas sp. SMT-1]QDW57873.1 hypothetical protein FFH79_013795 [Pseudomonas sp. KBS0802]
MKSLFPSHFPKSDADRKALWDECIFVFDTNVLTSLYKRSDEARSALLAIIKSLGDRVWIPHQVIYEFLQNRPAVAHQQAAMYSDAKTTLVSFLGEFESITKHPFLSKDLHSRFLQVSNSVIEELQAKAAAYDEMVVSDSVRDALAELLEGKVGGEYDKKRLDEIIKEGESRYANHIPPGFEDANKHKGSPIFAHVRARFGDLILWKQIIDYASERKLPVILVTGDQKDDWWLRTSGAKTLGPRPELMDEFRISVGANFYMYSHSKFLSLANDYLNQRTSSTVIQEIQDAALESAIEEHEEEESALEEPEDIFRFNEARHLARNIKHISARMRSIRHELNRNYIAINRARGRHANDELEVLKIRRKELLQLFSEFEKKAASYELELTQLTGDQKALPLDPLV